MLSFDDAFLEAVSDMKQSPSRYVRASLQALFVELYRRPIDVTALEAALVSLLEFLESPAGRTSANCTAVDLFMSFMGDELDWQAILPEQLAPIVADMGQYLHDTVDAPEVAQNLESTPEQLLARIRQTA